MFNIRIAAVKIKKKSRKTVAKITLKLKSGSEKIIVKAFEVSVFQSLGH